MIEIKFRKERVLAIDPGETTGYVVVEEGDTLSFLTGRWCLSELKDLLSERIYQGFAEGLQAIVIESFCLYRSKTQTLTNDPMIAAQVIGMFRLYSAIHNIPLVFQTASQVKGLFTDKRLKDLGFYVPNRHSRDAIRHALYYLMEKGDKS